MILPHEIVAKTFFPHDGETMISSRWLINARTFRRPACDITWPVHNLYCCGNQPTIISVESIFRIIKRVLILIPAWLRSKSLVWWITSTWCRHAWKSVNPISWEKKFCALPLPLLFVSHKQQILKSRMLLWDFFFFPRHHSPPTFSLWTASLENFV